MKQESAQKRRRQQRLLYLFGVTLGVAFVVLVAAILMLQRQSRNVADEIRLQSELNGRLRELQAILVHLSDGESGQRGFLLTGDPEYLGPYRVATERIPTLLRSLDGLEAVDPALQPRAVNVKRIVGERLAELAESIQLYQSGRQPDALVLMQTGGGTQTSAQIRREINSIADEVRQDRDQISAEIVLSGQKRQNLVAAAVAALAVCVLLAASQIGLLLSARTRFEKELQRSEARHRKIVEEQSELISLAKPDGTLTYVNPSYARQLGKTAEQLMGQNLFDHVEPSERAQVRDLVRNVLDTAAPAQGENRMVTPDGREMWVAWTNSLQFDDEGQKILHSVGRDITAQHNAEASLRESEEFLERTGRLAGVGGWELDLLTGKVRWSEQVRQLHEVANDFEPTTESGIAFFEPDDRAAISAAVQVAQQCGTHFDLELRLITAKGNSKCIRVVGDAEFDEHGKPVRLIGAMQDVTQRKELEDRVKESERFVREITDNLPIAIAYVDSLGRYQFVNKVHVKRFGRPREEILGKTRAQLTGQPSESAREKVSAVLQGIPQRFIMEEHMGDGVRLIDGQMVPAYDDRAEIKGFYAIGVDITDLKSTEARLRELTEIIENTPDYVVQTDWSGRVHYLNPAVRTALGFSEQSATEGLSFHQFNTPETNAKFEMEITPAIKRGGVWLGETNVVVDGGKVVPVNHLVIGHRDQQGRIARYSAVMRDISADVRARNELRLQTSTLNAIIESIPAMVAVLDKMSRYRLVNREFERQRSMRRQDVVGRSIAEVFGPEEYDERWPWIQRVLAGETVARERTAVHAGNVRNVSVTYIPQRLEDGSVDGFIVVAQDITSHRAEERRLLDLSERDALTGLLNRAGFSAYLQRRLTSTRAQEVALLFIDLDKFKPVNDTYGHAAGDAVLREYARRLVELVRPTDAVARLGGDEFAIVLLGARDHAAAHRVAQDAVDAAAQPFAVDGATVTIGACVGLALADTKLQDIEQLLARADEQVYAAKSAGRGRVASQSTGR